MSIFNNQLGFCLLLNYLTWHTCFQDKKFLTMYKDFDKVLKALAKIYYYYLWILEEKIYKSYSKLWPLFSAKVSNRLLIHWRIFQKAQGFAYLSNYHSQCVVVAIKLHISIGKVPTIFWRWHYKKSTGLRFVDLTKLGFLCQSVFPYTRCDQKNMDQRVCIKF